MDVELHGVLPCATSLRFGHSGQQPSVNAIQLQCPPHVVAKIQRFTAQHNSRIGRDFLPLGFNFRDLINDIFKYSPSFINDVTMIGHYAITDRRIPQKEGDHITHRNFGEAFVACKQSSYDYNPVWVSCNNVMSCTLNRKNEGCS